MQNAECTMPEGPVCRAENARRPDLSDGADGLARCASPEERIDYLTRHRA